METKQIFELAQIDKEADRIRKELQGGVIFGINIDEFLFDLNVIMVAAYYYGMTHSNMLPINERLLK